MSTLPQDYSYIDEIFESVLVTQGGFHNGRLTLDERDAEVAQARTSLIKAIEAEVVKGRLNEAKLNLAPLPMPNHIRSSRNSNTTRKRGAVAYFNTVVKSRREKRTSQLEQHLKRKEEE